MYADERIFQDEHIAMQMRTERKKQMNKNSVEIVS